ncbi:MAG: 50S ribosomal protein L11 methyltransferase [Bacteroidia bacterium]|nr:50S ribosomal protein L11 methyltransferase [Bacteroidia bacterium]
MNYFSVQCSIHPDSQEAREILTAFLAEQKFESFEETNEGITAYIKKNAFDPQKPELPITFGNDISVKYIITEIPEKNWNEEWEKNYEPVVINDECIIRAHFHLSPGHVKYDIVIEPKMSFGTGHHETTRLMVDGLLNMDVMKKSVLDMGCGTGVLAILAKMKGASFVMAIDNDEWAYQNCIENTFINNTADIIVLCGDGSLLKDQRFDIILANINLNILIADMKHYSNSLNHGGRLLLSGIYKSDTETICREAAIYHLICENITEKNQWVCLKMKREAT